MAWGWANDHFNHQISYSYQYPWINIAFCWEKKSQRSHLSFPIWAFQRNPKLVHRVGVTATGIWTVAHLQECLSDTLGRLGMGGINRPVGLMEWESHRHWICSWSIRSGVGSPYSGCSMVYCSCVRLPFQWSMPRSSQALQSVPTGHTEVRSKSGDKRRSSWCVLSCVLRPCSKASVPIWANSYNYIPRSEIRNEHKVRTVSFPTVTIIQVGVAIAAIVCPNHHWANNIFEDWGWVKLGCRTEWDGFIWFPSQSLS